ncbi:MAG: hypothetical protein ACJAZ2_001598 [Glaciecola sp.]|jgi:hypothetical protein
MKRITFIILFFCSVICSAQLRNTDPYGINLGLGNVINYTLEEVKKNDIKTVENWLVERNEKSGKHKEISFRYSITFDEAGNPTQFRSEYTPKYWWWPSFKRKIGLLRNSKEVHEYSFYYDSLIQLIHVKEYYYRGYGAFLQNDIYNTYQVGRLIKQEILERNMYKEKVNLFKNTVTGDSSLTTHVLSYHEGKVKTIDTESLDYFLDETDTSRFSAKYDVQFDSLFLTTKKSRGIEVDSFGRVIRSTLYTSSGTLLTGERIYWDSAADEISKYHYNDKGQLSSVETGFRQGDHISTSVYSYNQYGLIDSISYLNSNFLTVYRYQTNK